MSPRTSTLVGRSGGEQWQLSASYGIRSCPTGARILLWDLLRYAEHSWVRRKLSMLKPMTKVISAFELVVSASLLHREKQTPSRPHRQRPVSIDDSASA